MRISPRSFTIGLLASALLAGCTTSPASSQRNGADAAALQAAVDAPQREAANRARDVHRHPVETLAFFGVKPTDTVIEISPSAG